MGKAVGIFLIIVAVALSLMTMGEWCGTCEGFNAWNPLCLIGGMICGSFELLFKIGLMLLAFVAFLGGLWKLIVSED